MTGKSDKNSPETRKKVGGKEPVEDRPNVSTVKPDDYPDDDGGKPDYRKPGRS